MDALKPYLRSINKKKQVCKGKNSVDMKILIFLSTLFKDQNRNYAFLELSTVRVSRNVVVVVVVFDLLDF